MGNSCPFSGIFEFRAASPLAQSVLHPSRAPGVPVTSPQYLLVTVRATVTTVCPRLAGRLADDVATPITVRFRSQRTIPSPAAQGPQKEFPVPGHGLPPNLK